MHDSVLEDVKLNLGIIDESNVDFDRQIIQCINTSFFIIHQIGVGGNKPFVVKDSSTTWHEFSDKIDEMESLKTYVYMKTRLQFDPPQASSAMTALKEMIAELESRLNYYADY